MPYSNDDKIALKTLIDLESELLLRKDQLSAHLAESHSADSSEQAIERENDEVMVQLQRDTAAELIQVQAALKRLKGGNYHECSKCGEEISAGRLQALPYSTLCINCAE